MNDPYKVLGVTRNSTDEEIKKAYRELARKYHPDNYANTPLSDLAQEKMKEINEAYDIVSRERSDRNKSKSNSSYDNNYSSEYYGDADGFYDDGNRRNERYDGTGTGFADIRQLINEKNYYEADVRLNAVSSPERNAEWFFLKGCVFAGRGWYYEASRYYETACRMNPENAEYREALARIKSGGDATARRSAGLCDICSTLVCCDCCCESMGGDLISCC